MRVKAKPIGASCPTRVSFPILGRGVRGILDLRLNRWLAPSLAVFTRQLVLSFLLGALSLAPAAGSDLLDPGASEPSERRDLRELSLEELMDLEVVSVTKGSEKRLSVPAAVAVITGEDIRRSGATSLPEVLRMAPGLYVARVTSSIWGVSSRGFSSANSAKLLVLMDGRSLYTPLFSGVFWDVQDTPLEDIERIEVIRGPGGSLWGANAMNGVINVTTKSARDTHGTLVQAGGGTEERAFGLVRYGAEVGESFHYRVYAKYLDRDAGLNLSGPDDDFARMGRLGMRADWSGGHSDAITLQGDLYLGDVGQVKPSLSLTGGQGPRPQPPFKVDLSGGYLLSRWKRVLSGTSDVALQVYYDRTVRDDPFFHDELNTLDADLQHRFRLGTRHEILWGLSYRLMRDDFLGRSIVALDPELANDQLVSSFVQDDIRLTPSVRLVLGTKLEHNDFSGFELQPSGRISWDLSPRQAFWSAVSRAVRTPTRIERDVFAPLSAPSANPRLALVGNPGLRAEELKAFELGYRAEVGKVFLDLAAFYNLYDRLVTFGLGARSVGSDGHTLIPVENVNAMDGKAHGGEAALEWFPRSWWRISTSYSYLELHLDTSARALSPAAASNIEGASPRHQVAVRSFLDLPRGFALDASLRWVDQLTSSIDLATSQNTPSYTSLDVRLGWSAWQKLGLSLVGQNLLQSHHTESLGGTDVQRGVYGKLTWSW